MPVQAAKVKLNKKTVTINVGKTVQLKIKGTSKKAKWSSSNKNVATVSKKGKVKGKKAGTAIITAKVGKKKLKCKVTVKQPTIAANTKISFGEADPLTLVIGNSKTITVKTDKGYGITSNRSNNNIGLTWGNWISGTNNVKLKVTANKTGTSVITVYDSNKTSVRAKLNVKVINPPLNIKLPQLPKHISYRSSSGSLYSSCDITKVELEKNYYKSSTKYSVKLWLYGTKTYDYKPNVSSSCKVGYKLYDSEGYVVESGTFYSDSVLQDEKFKGYTYLGTDLKPGNYVLELLDVT